MAIIKLPTGRFFEIPNKQEAQDFEIISLPTGRRVKVPKTILIKDENNAQLNNYNPYPNPKKLTKRDILNQINNGFKIGKQITDDFITGGERVIDGALLNQYGNINEYLGGNYKERVKEQKEAVRRVSPKADDITSFVLELPGMAFGGLAGKVLKGVKGVPKVATEFPKVAKYSKYAAVPLLGAGRGGIEAYNVTKPIETASNIPSGAKDGAISNTLFIGGLKGTREVLKPINKIFSANMAIKGMPRGLENVVKNNKAVRFLKRGINVDDDVANIVKEQAPGVLQDINLDSLKKVNKVRGKNVPFDKIKESISKEYNDFFKSGKGEQQLLPLRKEIVKDVDNLFNPDGTKIQNLTEVTKPNYKSLFNDLTDWQKKNLINSLKTGKTKTLSNAGSVSALKKAEEELNSKINKAIRLEQNSNVRDLMEIKQRISDLLRTTNLKNIDKKYSILKKAEDFYKKGTKFNANDMKFDKLNFSNELNKRAFLQGFSDKILTNSEVKNVSKGIINNQRALKNTLDPSTYKNLMNNINNNDNMYKRANGLYNKAEYNLFKPEAKDRPWSEILESFTSLLGKGIDKTGNLITNNKYRKGSKYLLNPDLKLTPNFIDRINSLYNIPIIYTGENRNNPKSNIINEDGK
jgi:hypothetical protein